MGLENDIVQAIKILDSFTGSSKRDMQMVIPKSILANAYGLVFIRMYRAGFMISAKAGTGIIIARMPDGSWSAPSGVSLTSVGFGHQAGADAIDSIFVMNYRGAVKAFYDGGGQLQLGANASVSAGPLGRRAEVAASASSGNHVAATYAYSSSKGLYAGYSFEGSKISERVNTNASFYRRKISAREILTGMVPQPTLAQRLYEMLHDLGAGPRPGLPFAPKKSPVGVPGLPLRPSEQALPSQPPSNGQHAVDHAPHNASGSPLGASFGTEPSRPQNYSQANDNPSLDMFDPPPPYSPPASHHTNPVGTGDVMQRPPSQPHMANRVSFHEPSAPKMDDTGVLGGSSKNPFLPSSTLQSEPSMPFSYPRPNGTPNTTQSTTYPPGNQQSVTKPWYASQPHMSHAAPAVQAGAPVISTVVAIFDFPGQQPGDLPFFRGDHIQVTSRTDNRQSWWHGRIGFREGAFPANYTEDLVG